MSAFGGKADIGARPENVCFWHKADIGGLQIVAMQLDVYTHSVGRKPLRWRASGGFNLTLDSA